MLFWCLHRFAYGNYARTQLDRLPVGGGVDKAGLSTPDPDVILPEATCNGHTWSYVILSMGM